jgi:sphingolipid delta-4 desaturase
MIDFIKSETADEHYLRGKAILKKYPELKKFIRPYPLTGVYIILLTILQVFLAVLASTQPWYLVGLLAYCVGSFVALALFTLIHDVSHNLVSKRVWINYLYGYVANLALCVPLVVNYRYYHRAHHRFMGIPEYDVDMPSQLEMRFVKNVWWRKLVWLLLFFWPYGITRSLQNKTIKRFDKLVALNYFVQISFLVGLSQLAGIKSVLFLLSAMIFSISLSPAFGARGLLEHYVVYGKQETYSYYGRYNKLSFNNGYHVEHHDLMGVPWRFLPEVRRVASEYYTDRYSHKSYLGLIWRFLRDPEQSLSLRIDRATASVMQHRE